MEADRHCVEHRPAVPVAVGSADLPPPPPAAAAVFGGRLALAVRYAQLLVTDGIEHGLVGPREADRIWDRHLLNCAVVAELIPESARVVDVGSGAGLPGLVLACARADLRLQLVEPLERRVRFLDHAVGLLGLASQVEVIRGRADDRLVLKRSAGAEFVTSRAVAPLDRLARWCRPLLAPGGRLLAMKGERAAVEIEAHRSELARIGLPVQELALCGRGALDDPARVVVLERAAVGPRSRQSSATRTARTRETRRRNEQ